MNIFFKNFLCRITPWSLHYAKKKININEQFPKSIKRMKVYNALRSILLFSFSFLSFIYPDFGINLLIFLFNFHPINQRSGHGTQAGFVKETDSWSSWLEYISDGNNLTQLRNILCIHNAATNSTTCSCLNLRTLFVMCVHTQSIEQFFSFFCCCFFFFVEIEPVYFSISEKALMKEKKTWKIFKKKVQKKHTFDKRNEVEKDWAAASSYTEFIYWVKTTSRELFERHALWDFWSIIDLDKR